MGPKDTPALPGDRPWVLVVGAAARDIAPAEPRGWRLGGGVTYCSLALGRLGVRVRALIGADEAASDAMELDLLRDAGVEVAIVRLARGPVFDNAEGPKGRVQHCLSVSDLVRPDDLPAGWGRPDALVLAPVAAELDEGWAAVAAGIGLVALGWQGLLRTLERGAVVRRRPPERDRLVATARLIVVSREDLDPGIDADDLARLLAPGATLVHTRGPEGGLLLGPEPPGGGPRPRRTYRAIRADASVDPTGAGDVFLATLVALSLEPERFVGVAGRVDAELRLAAAAGSLTVEDRGLLGVPTLAAVLARARRVPGAPASR